MTGTTGRAVAGRDLGRRLARFSVIVIIASGLVLTNASPAAAHATLLSSDPQPNAILDTAPSTIVLRYSEPVDGELSEVEITVSEVLVDGVTTAAAPDDPAALAISLPADVGEGVAILRWRAFSSADGHLTRGILVFGIGADADPTAATFEQASAGIDTVDGTLRWLHLSAVVVLLGSVWSASTILTNRPKTALLLARWSGIAAIGVAATMLAAQVRLIGGFDGRSLATLAADLAFGSRWGLLWLARLAGVVTLVVLVYVVGRQQWSLDQARRRMRLVFVVPAAVVIVAQALASHSAGLDSARNLAVTLDAVHLAAASVWVGGLACLVVAGLAARNPSEASGFGDGLGDAFRHFGPWAFGASAVLAATGLYAAGRHATSLDAVLRSTWGQLLMVKLVVVALVVALGAVNSVAARSVVATLLISLRSRWESMTSRSEVGSEPPSTPAGPELADSGRRLGLEVGFGALALALVGFLTAAPTANGPEYAPAAEFGPDTRSAETGDVFLGLAIKPNRPGQNLLAVQAASTRRPPPAEISRVLVRADYLDDDRQLATIELEPTGDGQWELLDPVLSSPGNWKLEVVIRREGLVDQKALFDWPIPLVEPREPLVSDGRWTDLLTGVAIVGLGAIGLVAALTFVRHQRGSER